MDKEQIKSELKRSVRNVFTEHYEHLKNRTLEDAKLIGDNYNGLEMDLKAAIAICIDELNIEL